MGLRLYRGSPPPTGLHETGASRPEYDAGAHSPPKLRVAPGAQVARASNSTAAVGVHRLAGRTEEMSKRIILDDPTEQKCGLPAELLPLLIP